MSKIAQVISEEVIESKIYVIRGRKVMLDKDLAELYGVKTKSLNLAVKRNLFRFPNDFMFQLTKEEGHLRFQFETSKPGRGGSRYLPYAFTEQGVAMLSSVLNSRQAVLVNIQIMRTFTKIGEIMGCHEDLRRKIEAMEKKFGGKFQEHDHQFRQIFQAIRKLLAPSPRPKRRIGFHS